MSISRYLRDQRHARLLARARQGDADAFRQLYRELYDPVTHYLGTRLQNREDVEDLTARVFQRFLSRLESFDAARGSVAAWLLTMARNALVDHYRARKEVISLESVAEVLTAEGDDPLVAILRAEEAALVKDLLQELPPETREMFSLRFGHDLRYRDIASCLGLSEQAVKQRFSRTLRDLRIRLAQRSIRGGEVDYAV